MNVNVPSGDKLLVFGTVNNKAYTTILSISVKNYVKKYVMRSTIKKAEKPCDIFL